MNQWEIREKYIEMVNRYEDEKNFAKKIQMKHKFIDWMITNYNSLTEAEIEYLEKSISFVEDIHY